MRRALDLVYTCSCAASPRKGQRGSRARCRSAAEGGRRVYLGLAVPATAGDGDGTRADADAADGRDAEQERSAPVVGRPLGDVPVDTVVVVPAGW